MAQPQPFSAPGFDYGVELGQIERRRALANALQGQAFQPIEQQNGGPGQFAVPISPFQNLAKVAQAFAGMRQQNKADTAQRQLIGKIQSDYQGMLAKGLKQLQGTPATPMSEDAAGNVTAAQPAVGPDLAGALGTFGSHPGGAAFVPFVMEEMKRQQLIKSLTQGQQAPQAQPSPMNPASPNPSVMAGSGPVPFQGGQTPAPQSAPQMGGAASGIPLEAWLATDPSGKSYINHLAQQAESTGRVFYDQSGKAFTVNKNGQAMYLPGITARDKQEAVNLGGTTQFVNPYSPPQNLQHTPTMENRISGARLYHETGQNPLGLSTLPANPQATPQPVPLPAPRPTQIPNPQASRPPQAAPNARLTPKQQQELEQERPQATYAANSVIGGIDNALNTLQQLKTAKGLSNVTGPIAGRTPNMSGIATNAQALIDTLKNQLGLNELQRMREASKTGGAVGQVTEKEWPILQNALVALQQSQTTDQYLKHLGEVETILNRMKANTSQAYESRYGKLSPANAKPDNDPLGLRGGK